MNKKVEFRTDFEITDDDFEKVTNQFNDECDKWFENRKEIIDEFVAFYIASGIKHNAIWRGSLSGLINGAVETLAGYIVDDGGNKETVNKILLEKYHLKITAEKPLEVEELD